MNDDKVDAIIAMPVASAAYVVPGSVKGKCSQCGAAVWLAPSSLALGDIPILCLPCGLPEIIKAENSLQVVPGGRSEIIRGLKRACN